MSEFNQGVSRRISQTAAVGRNIWGSQQLVRGVDLVPKVPGSPAAPQYRGAKPLGHF